PTPFSLRGWLRSLFLASAIGFGAGVLLSIGNRPGERWISMAYGFLAGLGISLISRTLIHLLNVWLEPTTAARRTFAYAVLFLVSGIAAWMLAGLLLNALFGLGIPIFSGGSLVSVGITGSLAIVIGLAIASFERMKDRLAESVARLKEVEFAER